MLKKRTIETLVIEDDPFFVATLKLYCDKMLRFKLNIHHSITIEESLSLLDKNPQIELILLDYRIHSKITGLEILQHLREKGVNLPVIIITGSGNQEVAVKMMKAGASDYLIKGSINPEILENSIKNALERYRGFLTAMKEESDSVLKDIAIKTSLNGVCVMELNFVITYINPSFIAMWGYKNEHEIRGKNIRELLETPIVVQEITDFLKTKKSWLGELVGIKSDSSTFFVQALFSLVELKDKKTQQIMASFVDITRVKQEEEKRESLYKGIMEVFALRAEEVGNIETAGHIRRIATYVRLIAEKLSKLAEFKNYIDKKYINDISYASMLHDVGKWRTPNEILLKPTSLSEAEWIIMQQHTRLGAEMLSPLLKDKGTNQYLKLVESIILYHHEKWDGTGYPEKLKGEEIPLSARIVALADMYDALTSLRSYRKALTHIEAVELIKKEKDRFDPRILSIFIDNQDEFQKIKNTVA